MMTIHLEHRLCITDARKIVRKEMESSESHRFELENLSILTRLSHLNIIELLASYTYKGRHSLIFPLAEDGTFADCFTRDSQATPFQSKEAFLVAFAQLSSAIAQVHDFVDDREIGPQIYRIIP